MQNNGRRWGRTDPGSGIAGPALPRRDGSFSTGFSLLMNKPQRVSDLLQVDSLPRLEARMLLQHVLRVSRTWLITHDTDWVAAPLAPRFQALLARRLAGEPKAYLGGERAFLGYCFEALPQGLIPRH